MPVMARVAGAVAVAFDVAEAVEGGGAVGGCGLGEEGAGDVAVGEGEEGDGEVAAGVGGEGGAGWAGEDELAREGDVEGEGFGGEVVDGELAGERRGCRWGWGRSWPGWGGSGGRSLRWCRRR